MSVPAPSSRLAWYDDEAGFAAELARGRKAELRVAVRLLPLGLAVKVGELFFRDGRAGDDPRCSDQPDIQVEGRHLLEVKGRAFAFTGPDDYPYDTAFVGAQRRWSGRTVMPCCVVLLSEPTGRFVVAPTNCRGEWEIERRLDGRRDFVEESCAVPRRLLLPESRLLEHLQRPCPAGINPFGDKVPF